MFQSFLVDKISNGGRDQSGIERATYIAYSSALHKLELALNKYSEVKNLGRVYDFGLKEVGKYAASALGDKCVDSRAYQDVNALVAAVPGRYNLLANVLRETGFRIS